MGQAVNAACADTVDAGASVLSNGFGANPFNTRNQPSTINSGNVGRMALVFSHGDAEATERRGAPVVTSQAIFAVIKFHVVAVNRVSGCEYWRYSPFAGGADQIRAGFRSIYFLHEGGGKPALLFAGDGSGHVHAVDAQTGKVVWKKFLGTDPDHHVVTGTPIAGAGKLFVPISTIEVARTVFVDETCCRSHGMVQAVDPYTGDLFWTFHVTENATRQADHPARLGPNGGSVWGSPALDVGSSTLFIGTGQNLTQPVTATSDAIIALDTETGKVKWSFQTTQDDAWNVSCQLPELWGKEAKCDRPEGRDFDVGAAPLLTTLPSGADVVIGGAKNGVVYALERSTGKLVWSSRVGVGANLGGIHWGMATDGSRLYAGVSDLNVEKLTTGDFPSASPKQVIAKGGKPGVYALDLKSGKVEWETHPTREYDGATVPSIFSAAISVTNDVVFGGALNGMLYAFSAKDGTVLWSYNTLDRKNEVDAQGHKVRGGTIDGAGPLVAGSDLLVNSGYATFGGANQFHGGHGNALFVFRTAAHEESRIP